MACPTSMRAAGRSGRLVRRGAGVAVPSGLLSDDSLRRAGIRPPRPSFPLDWTRKHE